ncbi:MAG: adenylyltransferase/cytidyltransferase family protein [Bacteroidales bacterium]
MNKPKVFVSGCYDLLHSGHVAFFEEAASHGDLYVGIGSDQTIFELKARKTVNPENERLYMVKALRCVKEAWVNRGSGVLDFLEDMKALNPDILFVNSDGHSPEKEKLCSELGIRYVVSKRIPREGLPARSTTALRQECRIPYRIDLAGGWLDQPYVSKYYPGAVLTISIEPDYEFNDRAGMATSSRKKAIELWQTDIPEGESEKLAKILFCFENPPGTSYVSGSQDSLGIVLPGLNRLYYNNHYWPEQIESIHEPDMLEWIESRLWLVPLAPRASDFNVLSNTSINEEGARRLSKAADDCWKALQQNDTAAFGQSFRESFEAQISMFPNMVSKEVFDVIDQYSSQTLGWKLSGAGGGGYIIFVSETPIEKAFQIRIRRK